MRTRARSRLALTLSSAAPLLSLAAGACFHAQYQTKPAVAVVEGDPIVQMAPPAALPSLDNPSYSLWKAHTDPPAPWEPVVGIAGRGYPLGLLDRYEVVNDDSLASHTPYVVTRCPLAGLAAVYDRRIGGRTLTFINSGALWRDTLVLEDRETGTLWTAATGEALYGPLQGERLTAIPATIATMNSYAEANPRARYLDTGELTETSISMALYNSSGWQGFSGFRTRDARFDPKAKVYSISEGTEALAFVEEDVKGRGCVAAFLAGRPVLVEWDAERDAPRAFRGSADGSVEIAVVPMYWFALDRHFETVRTLGR
ncbi:MAG TPA: DUF3179 domain-containing (seleno)protein [Thermoanaerobaculia bacterium]|jgi:hypothetical protein